MTADLLGLAASLIFLGGVEYARGLYHHSVKFRDDGYHLALTGAAVGIFAAVWRML